MKMVHKKLGGLFVALVVLSLACSLGGQAQPSIITVEISSPQDGDTVAVGQQVFVVASAVAGQCCGISSKPYGSGGYTTSYMGGYDRVHGASYLSRDCFGSFIYLRDVWIDGTEVVLEFFNADTVSAQNMSCYGMVVVK